MDNFKTIYKILKYLESAMDYDEIDYSRISFQALGISENRWRQILIMLAQNGYISGIVYGKDMSGMPYIAEPIQPLITLKGLEYLTENSMMAKVRNLRKGIAETSEIINAIKL